jgi:hypothetical protein
MSALETHQAHRILWAQVVLQAKADLENEPIDSILFDQAAAFFVGGGEWGKSRAIIADCLGMHRDDLYRRGECWIAERRQREVLDPKPARVSRPKSPVPGAEGYRPHQGDPASPAYA